MIYEMALFFIPFENFFFAPSSGWGAIAPIVFFIYVILNFKFIINHMSKLKILISVVIVIISLLNYLINPFLFFNFLDNLIQITLGISFYLALQIRYIYKNGNIIKDLKILAYSYLITLLIGVGQFFVYKLNITKFIDIIKILSKRFSYPRVQFTYTEPSFIPLHLFGVFLIFILFLRKNNVKIPKQVYYIYALNVIICNIISKSTRLLLDTLVVIVIITVISIIKSKNNYKKIITLALLPIFFIVGNTIVENDYRLGKIKKEGIYIDDSLSSRWFRVNSSLIGYGKDLKKIILGYGIGNQYIPMHLGYTEAREQYKNDYLVEVDSLKTFKPTSLFSMPIKIVSEFGIVIFLLLIMYTISYKYLDIYMIVVYLYLQFDSYALYTIWLYLFFKNKFFEKKD